MKDSLKRDVWKFTWALLGWVVNAWIYVKLGIIQYAIIFGIGVLIGKAVYDDVRDLIDALDPLLAPFSIIPLTLSELTNHIALWRCKKFGYECYADNMGVVDVLIPADDFEEFVNNIEEIRSEVARKLKWPRFLIRVYWR